MPNRIQIQEEDVSNYFPSAEVACEALGLNKDSILPPWYSVEQWGTFSRWFIQSIEPSFCFGGLELGDCSPESLVNDLKKVGFLDETSKALQKWMHSSPESWTVLGALEKFVFATTRVHRDCGIYHWPTEFASEFLNIPQNMSFGSDILLGPEHHPFTTSRLSVCDSDQEGALLREVSRLVEPGSEDELYFHGTSLLNAAEIVKSRRPNVNLGRYGDFGNGFYTTPQSEVALRFAKRTAGIPYPSRSSYDPWLSDSMELARCPAILVFNVDAQFRSTFPPKEIVLSDWGRIVRDAHKNSMMPIGFDENEFRVFTGKISAPGGTFLTLEPSNDTQHCFRSELAATQLFTKLVKIVFFK